MSIHNISLDSWRKLDIKGDQSKGYQTLVISSKDSKNEMHLFIDEKGYHHFAIDVTTEAEEELIAPKVHGLTVGIKEYRINGTDLIKVIDIICERAEYLEEFCGVANEIACLVEEETSAFSSTNQVIRNWISFWSKKPTSSLTTEQILGLIGELLVLQKLLKVNAEKALESWVGPLGNVHDFEFKDWSFEVKSTRSNQRVHTINGIGQLDIEENRNLGFISIKLEEVNNEEINLISEIYSTINCINKSKRNLVSKFSEKLSELGYSPIHNNEYLQYNVRLIDMCFFEVGNDFPRITERSFGNNFNERVIKIDYDISLLGMECIDFTSINLGKYFY
jgi:hypothetical protein